MHHVWLQARAEAFEREAALLQMEALGVGGADHRARGFSGRCPSHLVQVWGDVYNHGEFPSIRRASRPPQREMEQRRRVESEMG